MTRIPDKRNIFHRNAEHIKLGTGLGISGKRKAPHVVVLPSEIVLLVLRIRHGAWNATGLYHLV
jgi:hypothetical protein